MSRMKYIPTAIGVLTLLIFFFAFNPLASFLAGLGLFSRNYANILAAILIMLPTLFIIGINANRRLFGFIMIIIGLLLIMGFFIFA